MTTSGVPAQVTGVRTVAVPVGEQERALAFYTGVLGMRTRLDAPFGGGRWLEVAPPGGTTSLALVTDRPAGIDTGIRLTTPDAAAAHAALRAAGVDTDPEVLRYPGVPPMFAVRDPDGNRLVLLEDPSVA
jgi:catechol 2,3-dioxygenase-like lactoylglutathione lyase family enzyme